MQRCKSNGAASAFSSNLRSRVSIPTRLSFTRLTILTIVGRSMTCPNLPNAPAKILSSCRSAWSNMSRNINTCRLKSKVQHGRSSGSLVRGVGSRTGRLAVGLSQNHISPTPLGRGGDHVHQNPPATRHPRTPLGRLSNPARQAAHPRSATARRFARMTHFSKSPRPVTYLLKKYSQ